MATFTERLRILVDWDGRSADTGIKGFVGRIKEAEGASGKLKAGFQGAADGIKANAGALAVTAGAALVTFGIKAVGAFTETAKAALDLGRATGLSTEQASRWIAVADDYAVGADAIQAALGRIGKDLDAAKWEKYGIATRDAGGAARDANALFLDVLDVLNRTPEGAERSRVAAELLGRGWQGIAPLLGQTRSEYEAMLGSVESGQVVTDEEAAKAEKWRLAVDKLQDAFGEFALKTGEALSDLAPVMNIIADGIGLVGKAIDGVVWYQRGLADMAESAGRDARRFFDDTADANWALVDATDASEQAARDFNRAHLEGLYTFEEVRLRVMGLTNDMHAANLVALEWAEAQTEADKAAANLGMTAEELSDKQGTLKRAADALTDALDEQTDAYKRAHDGAREYEGAAMDVTEAQLDLADQQAETNAVLADANATEADRQRALIDLRRAQLNLNDSLFAQADAYAASTGAQEGSTAYVSAQVSELERLKAVFPELKGEIDAYIRTLGRIPATVNTTVSVTGSKSSRPIGMRQYASGTTSAEPGIALVGEEGPELVQFSGGERVFPAGQTNAMLSTPRPIVGGGGGINVNVSVSGVVTSTEVGREIANVLQQWYDDGGRAGWL